MVADPAGTPVTRYVACDHLYSPSALLDDSGTVLERYEYDAYGQRRVYNADLPLLPNQIPGQPSVGGGCMADVAASGLTALML